VSKQDFSDAALVVLGHGSTLHPEAGATVFQHAAELRRRKCFAEVREGFWKQQPRVTEVMRSLTTPRVFVAPLFAAEGHFSEVIIPQALGFLGQGAEARILRRQTQVWIFCKPVGTHELITEVISARGREVIQAFPFPHQPAEQETTLFITGHGTEQNENSRNAVEQQVERLRAQHEYADVQALFLDEEPRIGACYQLAKTRNILVVPFFMSNGMHVSEDIPRLLGESERELRRRLDQGKAVWRNPTERHGKLVWYAASVGTAPEIADIIMQRVHEASLWENAT
jgi:sirohydrochlorin cobaltochelatase